MGVASNDLIYAADTRMRDDPWWRVVNELVTNLMMCRALRSWECYCSSHVRLLSDAFMIDKQPVRSTHSIGQGRYVYDSPAG